VALSTRGDRRGLAIVSPTDAGVLYGVFHLLRMMEADEMASLPVVGEPKNDLFNDIAATSPDLLLFFHHVPRHYRLPNRRLMGKELNHRYDTGVAAIDGMIERWSRMEGEVDEPRDRRIV